MFLAKRRISENVVNRFEESGERKTGCDVAI